MPSAPCAEDAKPRPSPFGEGFVRRRIGKQEWHVRPDLGDEFLGPGGLRLDEWIAAGVAVVVKSGPHRTVYRLSLPSGVYYLKHYKLAGPRAWLQNNLRPCRAYREAAASVSVREAGIDTAEAVAVGRVTTGPFSRDSFFVTREIPGVVALDEVVRDAAGVSTADSRAPASTLRGRDAPGMSPVVLRQAITQQLAVLTAALHRGGLFHADYHAGNVLVRPGGDGGRLWLIDLHPLRAVRMTVRRRRAMLGMLAASLAPHATRADRRRFFGAYRAALGVGEDVRAVEEASAAEVCRRQQRADRKWRRGNRRVVILDGDGVECRGLAELGRERLIALRDLAMSLDGAARRDPRPRGICVRRLPGGKAARSAWEVGHALLRRGFPIAKPLLFVSNTHEGLLITDRPGESVPLASWCVGLGTSILPSVRDRTLAALGRLLRRLHEAGFDASPDAFAVTSDGALTLTGVEDVVQRRMPAGRRRDGVARLLACLPTTGGRAQVLKHYGADEPFVRAVWSRLRSNPPARGAGRAALSSAGRTAAALLLAVAASLSLVSLAGCRSLDKPPQAVALPAKHSVRAEHLVLISDFKLPKDDPLVDDLIALREHVTTTLQLPEPRQDVTVYLFSNEGAYRKYLDTVHPGLPPRRAYFVGTKSELAVYTYWGDRVLEDLRHEYTHGILHASLSAVPLWLDEGLAEYFEVPGTTPGAMNGDYPHQLAVAVSRGWRPDIARLEELEEFSQMRRLDYQESWAWVHYLLHASPDTRAALLAYVGDLRDAEHPPALSERVAAVEPSFPSRFLGYVATLNSTGGAVIRAASAEF